MERSGNFYKAIQLGYILISILIGCMAYNSLYEWQEIEALELVQSPNQKIPDRKTKCVIETHLNIKQNVIFGANLKPV